MNIIKDNWWNRIFHKEELAKQQFEQVRCQRIIDNANGFLEELQECNGLRGLLYIHKQLWNNGFWCEKLSPSESGMFRTKNIMEMKAEEVFLGDIYGMWSFNIPDWEKEKEKGHKYGANTWGLDPDVLVYDLVVNQYRHVLMSGVKKVKKEAEETLAGFKNKV